jgi:hypothetical protein
VKVWDVSLWKIKFTGTVSTVVLVLLLRLTTALTLSPAPVDGQSDLHIFRHTVFDDSLPRSLRLANIPHTGHCCLGEHPPWGGLTESCGTVLVSVVGYAIVVKVTVITAKYALVCNPGTGGGVRL